MENTSITVLDNIRIPYSEENESFHAALPFETYKITVDLVCDPDNEDDKRIVKETLEKIYEKPNKTRAEWMIEIEYKLLPLTEKSKTLKTVNKLQFENEYRLANITIQKMGDDDVQIDASFDELNPEEPDFPESLCVSGNFETGFTKFYVNGFHIGVFMDEELVQRPDHKLSTGDVAECELGDNVYKAEVDILDDYAECIFELDEDHVGAEKAFALFEKVYAKIDLFVQMSQKFLRSRMQDKINDIRNDMEQPRLTVDEIMEDMNIDSIRFMNNGMMEFGYYYMGDIYDADIYAKGSYNMGFTNYYFIVVDDEDEDDE